MDVCEIVVKNALGVCSVEEDTRLLAQVSAEVAPAGGRVLDLGTGTGYVAIYLARRGFVVDATDVSRRALELARGHIDANGVLVNLYHSDLFSDVRGPYDLIAFNPPMNPGETELTRLATSFFLGVIFMEASLVGVSAILGWVLGRPVGGMIFLPG